MPCWRTTHGCQLTQLSFSLHPAAPLLSPGTYSCLLRSGKERDSGRKVAEVTEEAVTRLEKGKAPALGLEFFSLSCTSNGELRQQSANSQESLNFLAAVTARSGKSTATLGLNKSQLRIHLCNSSVSSEGRITDERRCQYHSVPRREKREAWTPSRVRSWVMLQARERWGGLISLCRQNPGKNCGLKAGKGYLFA